MVRRGKIFFSSQSGEEFFFNAVYTTQKQLNTFLQLSIQKLFPFFYSYFFAPLCPPENFSLPSLFVWVDDPSENDLGVSEEDFWILKLYLCNLVTTFCEIWMKYYLFWNHILCHFVNTFCEIMKVHVLLYILKVVYSVPSLLFFSSICLRFYNSKSSIHHFYVFEWLSRFT